MALAGGSPLMRVVLARESSMRLTPKPRSSRGQLSSTTQNELKSNVVSADSAASLTTSSGTTYAAQESGGTSAPSTFGTVKKVVLKVTECCVSLSAFARLRSWVACTRAPPLELLRRLGLEGKVQGTCCPNHLFVARR